MRTILSDPAAPPASSSLAPLLSAEDVTIRYPGSARPAVDGVSLQVLPGETLGVVGESGSGKSTLARAMCGLERWQSGTIRYAGEELVPGRPLRRDQRLDLQMVFQDPASALNPRRRIGSVLVEALSVRGRRASVEDAEELLAEVGLPGAFLERYPRQASGGQLQRVVIARALAATPKVLLADEPVSALDVSVQAQVLDLLVELRERLRLSMLFVSHDLAVIRHISDRVAVMRRGELVEIGEVEDVIRFPRTDYTRELLAAVPDPDAGSLRSR